MISARVRQEIRIRSRRTANTTTIRARKTDLINTRFTGIRYSSFHGGEVGVRYTSGDRFPMRIFGESGELMSFDDFYWSPEDYIRALVEAGSSDVSTIVPEVRAMP
jgi:hypothetical protein